MSEIAETGLPDLIERVIEANFGEDHPRLNEAVAIALGWRTKCVTGLGVNGRTPGRWLWFPPNETFGSTGRSKPPQLLNLRREQTLAALRARHALALSKRSDV